MEAEIIHFLDANKERPKIIILGEEHMGDFWELSEMVGKELTVIDTLHSSGIPFTIYSELPKGIEHKLTPNFTVFYLYNKAKELDIPFNTSEITAEIREIYGSSDALYSIDILQYLNTNNSAAGGAGVSNKSKLVVAVLGLLHAADMEFPSSISVLRLNCISKKKTNFAISELNKTGTKYNRNTSELIKTKLPYIADPKAVALGEETVFRTVSSASASASASGSSNASGIAFDDNTETRELFVPIWLKNKFGDWVAKCPICGLISGTNVSALTHKFNCANKNKNVDISTKPAAGGKRRTKRRLRKLYNHTKSRKN